MTAPAAARTLHVSLGPVRRPTEIHTGYLLFPGVFGLIIGILEGGAEVASRSAGRPVPRPHPAQAASAPAGWRESSGRHTQRRRSKAGRAKRAREAARAGSGMQPVTAPADCDCGAFLRDILPRGSPPSAQSALSGRRALPFITLRYMAKRSAESAVSVGLRVIP